MGKKKQPHSSSLKNQSDAQTAIHSIDWTNHPLGSPANWPASLRISLNTVLDSEIPMLLFWQSEYYCFYNDAFIESLDTTNKHPGAMGKKAEEVWKESWTDIKHIVDRVYHQEESVSYEDYSFPLFHNNISFGPVRDEEENVTAVLAICRESTSAIDAERELKELYDEKNRILESITDGFYAINENWIITHWNPEAEKLLGMKREDVLGENLWEVFPAGKKLKFYPEFNKTMKERIPASFEEYYEPWGKWFSFNVYPSRNGISVYFRDITRQRRLQLIHERTEEISGVAGWELDLTTEKVFMTAKAYEIYGLPKNSIINTEVNKKLYDVDSLEKIDKAIEQAINNQKPYEIELNLKQKDEEHRIIRINGFPLIREGKVAKLYGTLEEVTQEKKEKKKLEDTIQKLKTAQKIGNIGYWTHNIVKNKGEWSEEVYDIWEVDPETFEPTFENLLETIHPDDKDILLRDVSTAYPDQNYQENEHRIITPDGGVKWIRARITLHRDENGEPRLLEGISQDITEKKKREEEILQTLREKETLLEEVHHRVKNNLAVVSSMVQLQAYEETNDEVKQKLMDSVVRIISMASIHEQLYQSHSFSKLDLSKSLKKLVKKIVETMDPEVPIILEFDLNQVDLNINQAIPFSLIVNEVVTNVIKHAFQGKSKGKIKVTLSEKDSLLHLSIKDNGIGIPEDFEIKKNQTLGLNLIDTLAKQLDAEYNYNSTELGTSFNIQFERLEIKGAGSANI